MQPHRVSDPKVTVKDEPSAYQRLVPLNHIIRLAAANPAEVFDRARNLFELRSGRESGGQLHTYHPEPDWIAILHGILDLPWPCQQGFEFASLWQEVQRSLAGKSEIDPAFDADIGLARAAWCIVRHLEPVRVVETGVARGVTSWIVLEALQRNQHGHLWSIDLPPLAWTIRAGAAVPDSLHRRWTYIRGSSRRRLPSLVKRIGPVEVFIHDSLHTERNLRFELSTAWPWLSPSAVVLADDIDQNRAFGLFLQDSRPALRLIAPKETRNGMFGIIVKRQTTPVHQQ